MIGGISFVKLFVKTALQDQVDLKKFYKCFFELFLINHVPKYAHFMIKASRVAASFWDIDYSLLFLDSTLQYIKDRPSLFFDYILYDVGIVSIMFTADPDPEQLNKFLKILLRNCLI